MVAWEFSSEEQVLSNKNFKFSSTTNTLVITSIQGVQAVWSEPNRKVGALMKGDSSD